MQLIVEPFQIAHANNTYSKIDWGYYCIYLMVIHAFCVMLSHFFCDNGRGASHAGRGFPYYILILTQS